MGGVQRTAAEASAQKRVSYVAELETDQEASHVGEIASPARAQAENAEIAEGIYEETPAEAHASSVAHDDPLAHEFFEQSEKLHEELDEHEVIHHMSRGSRRAMYASVGIFAVSIVAIGGYSVYQNWIMPAPVELGASMLDIPAVPTAAPVVAAAPQPVLRHPSLQAPPEAAPAQVPAQVLQPFVVHGAAPTAAPAAVETQLSAATNPAVQPAAANPTQPVAVNPPAQPAAIAPAVAAAQPAPVQFANAVPAAAPALAAAPAPAAAQPKPETIAPAVTQLAVPLTAAKAQLTAKTDSDAPTDEAAPSPTGGPTYDELVAVGRALSKKNRRVEAGEAFRRALVQAPQGSAALSGLGFVYLNADDKQNAKEFAQRAVLADASNAEGWIVLGAALEMLGDRAGAKDAYKNCVERGQGPYLNECRKVAR